jgi:hypothetical protein
MSMHTISKMILYGQHHQKSMFPISKAESLQNMFLTCNGIDLFDVLHFGPVKLLDGSLTDVQRSDVTLHFEDVQR